jgi:hypothetical protein
MLVLPLSSVPALAADGPASSSSTSAPAVADCAKWYEQGQVQRQAGQLLAARQTLQLCANDQCPSFVREDCGAWFVAVQNELPTLVFTAQSRGRDLSEVRISVGARVLTTRIDGRAIELDPGEYDLSFEAPGMQPLTQHVVIARGEQNRLLRVELTPLASDDRDEPLPAPLPRAERSLLVPGIFAGVGVLGVAGFGALGAWGKSSEASLEDTCAPHCDEGAVSRVRTKYLFADISLGVGVASLAAGVYLLLSAPSDAQPPRASGVDVQASANGLSASYGGVF